MNKETILKYIGGTLYFRNSQKNLMLEEKNFYLNLFTVRNAYEI